MLPPSGEQLEIGGGGYAAVVTEAGATLRVLSHHGRDLVDGFPAGAMACGGRGQLLAPWPNRLRDGRYSFGGREHQLAISEPRRGNASHGLVRWAAWQVLAHTASTVELGSRLMAQTGYPWTLDLQVRYELSAAGLRVTQSAVNRSAEPAPFASGAHPYLAVGPGPVDRLELTLPAATRSLSDERLLPVGLEPVAGTAYDFRSGRAIGTTVFDDAFTDLDRSTDGTASVVLRKPAGPGVELWVDERHRWLQVYSADDVPATARRSLAVEPMTARADALRSGEDLVVLTPAGTQGERFEAEWGIRALS